MKSGMLRVRHYSEIRNVIVRWIAVDVVNNLIAAQWSAKMLLHDIAMFLHDTAAFRPRDNDVASVEQGAFPFVMSGTRTALTSHEVVSAFTRTEPLALNARR